MSGIKRREARELVVALLFETEFKDGETVTEIYELSAENREIPDDDYIKRAYFGVCEHKEQIDALIGNNSRGWKTHRLTKLSRSIMRLAVYEMLFEDKIQNEKYYRRTYKTDSHHTEEIQVAGKYQAAQECG